MSKQPVFPPIPTFTPGRSFPEKFPGRQDTNLLAEETFERRENRMHAGEYGNSHRAGEEEISGDGGMFSLARRLSGVEEQLLSMGLNSGTFDLRTSVGRGGWPTDGSMLLKVTVSLRSDPNVYYVHHRLVSDGLGSLRAVVTCMELFCRYMGPGITARNFE